MVSVYLVIKGHNHTSWVNGGGPHETLNLGGSVYLWLTSPL